MIYVIIIKNSRIYKFQFFIMIANSNHNKKVVDFGEDQFFCKNAIVNYCILIKKYMKFVFNVQIQTVFWILR
jgi:hypothetical protein